MKAERFTVTKPELFYIFLALSSCYLLISYFTNNYLLTDDFYVSIWSEEFSSDRVEQLLSTTKRIEWVIYLLTPIFLFLKMLLIAVSIQAGLYLGNIELSFKKCSR